MPDLEETLQRIACTFTIRDIMVPKEKLAYASGEDVARQLLDTYPDFDIIPIERGGEIYAYLERGSDNIHHIKLQDIASDATSIIDVVDILTNRRHLFVLVSNSIGGYIHFSDLNNHLVKLPFFILIEMVEHYLISKIDGLITEDTLIQVLDQKRFNDVKDRMRRQKEKLADLNWISLLSFNEVLRFSCHFNIIRLKATDIEKMSQTRNCICHADKALIGSQKDVKRLANVKSIYRSILAEYQI